MARRRIRCRPCWSSAVACRWRTPTGQTRRTAVFTFRYSPVSWLF